MILLIILSHEGLVGELPLIKRLALFAQEIFEFFLPRLCLFCSEPAPVAAANAICPGCEAQVQPVVSPLCPCCGRVFGSREGADHLCGPCQTEPPPFDRALAAVIYEEEGPTGLAIKRLKYGRRFEYLPLLRAWLGAPACRELAAAADLVAPVPLHPRRLRERGFNQAVLLARSFPEAPFSRDALTRLRPTRPQTGLSPPERRDNVKGAFAVTRPALVDGRHVCLVDDVYTTGATVRECARALKKAGASAVTVLTVARVRYD